MYSLKRAAKDYAAGNAFPFVAQFTNKCLGAKSPNSLNLLNPPNPLVPIVPDLGL